MKNERNFKIRIYNGPQGDKTYLINAENHYEVYQRFCGIMLNNGYYHTRAMWRPFKTKPPTISQLRRYPTRMRPKRSIRTYYFYPKDVQYENSYDARKPHEAAIEIIRLK